MSNATSVTVEFYTDAKFVRTEKFDMPRVPVIGETVEIADEEFTVERVRWVKAPVDRSGENVALVPIVDVRNGTPHSREAYDAWMQVALG